MEKSNGKRMLVDSIILRLKYQEGSDYEEYKLSKNIVTIEVKFYTLQLIRFQFSSLLPNIAIRIFLV